MRITAEMKGKEMGKESPLLSFLSLGSRAVSRKSLVILRGSSK